MLKVLSRIPPAWKTAIFVGMVARVCLALWGFVIYAIGIPSKIYDSHQIYYWGIEPVTEGLSGVLWGIWQRWDVIHYMRIAQSGYSHEDLSVFLPFYPFLGKVFSSITGLDSLIILSLVSLISTIFSMVLLYRIVYDYIDPALAKSSLIFLVFFPSSFFYFVPYPQSLVLMLVLLCTLLALRNKWILAAISGFAAGLTHMTLIASCATLGYLALANLLPRFLAKLDGAKISWISRFLTQIPQKSQSGSWFSLVAMISPVAGSVTFLAWRWWQGFQPLSEFQLVRWERTTQWPWENLIRIPSIFSSPWFGATGWINLVVFIFVIAVSIWSIKRLPAWMWLFQVIGLILILSTGTIQDPLGGLDRYALYLYPIFIALASWTQGRNRLRLYLLALFAVLQLYLSFLYIQWVWVG